MKFVSYNYDRDNNLGILIEDRVMPLNRNTRFKFNSMIELIENMNEDLMDEIESIISTDHYNYLPLNALKLLAPIPYPRRNVFCLGKNYEEHAREIKITKISDTGIPDYPIYFTKTATPAIAHGDQIKFSHQATKQVDYEVELAVVIGKEGINIKPEEAEDYIFGYTIVNDVSARDLQAEHNQWFKGKSLDTFCPMGPSIVYKKEIPFPVELNIQCSINGELRQTSNTRNMIFNIPYIISDLSRGLTLKAGDIICTGTPSGVGMGFEPPKLLNDGDIIECYIEKIGKLVNKVSVVASS
jgi:2-keto-4-pentenoate hydratase/2-oxohepta-3-ene-1,7-dioic acid hydratase in catechol pathway